MGAHESGGGASGRVPLQAIVDDRAVLPPDAFRAERLSMWVPRAADGMVLGLPPFRGHRLSGLGGRCCDPALEGYRRDLAERAVAPAVVVDGVDPAADGVDRLGSGAELVALVELGFQGRPEAFLLGVVPAHPDAQGVRDQILFYPESHQQDVLASGEVVGQLEMAGKYRGHEMDVINPVKGCVAGWTCHLNGDQLVVPQRDHDYSVDASDSASWDAYLRFTYPDDGPARAATVCSPEGGKRITAWDRAAELLELDRDERTWLFADERSREEVLHALDSLGKGDSLGFQNLVHQAELQEGERS